MNQAQHEIKHSLFSRLRIKKWLKSTSGRSISYILMWLIFSLFLRFILIESFYKDTNLIKNWITAGQVIPTIIIYYFFGYFVFPNYLYRLRIGISLLWLFFWHVIIYEGNYLLFGYIQHFKHSSRIERDWLLFHNAGPLGFITNGTISTWSFFYTFPWALIFLGVLAVNHIVIIRIRNTNLEKDKLIIELTFLKSQINPHFLFNTLNSIYADVFDTNEKAADLVLRLSELMRYNLYETDLPKIALVKELAYIQNYLDLERNRLSDRYVVMDYEQSGQVEQYQIAPLLLIAFVENAFKHGLKGTIEPAYVQISVDVKAGKFVFRVENSVPAKRPMIETMTKSGGIGLDNVRRRLDILYNGQHELIIHTTETTYTITLTIQIEPLR